MPGSKASLLDRFMAKTTPEPNTGCWIWLGAITNKGYGRLGLGTREDGHATAHRVAWMLFRGADPAGSFVCHRCDNRWCVNPHHLFLGTAFDNTADMMRKGRHGRARISLDDRLNIIASGLGHRELAERYGVSPDRIYNIRRREETPAWAATRPATPFR